MKVATVFLVLLAPAAFAQESHDALLQHWDYDEHTPLKMEQTGVQERDGVSIYDISFVSPVGSRSTSVGQTVASSEPISLFPPDLVRFQR